MTKAQRNVLSATLFVLGTVAALVFVGLCSLAASEPEPMLPLLVICAPVLASAVALWGAAFYVQAGRDG
jgi:hypothetical protein